MLALAAVVWTLWRVGTWRRHGGDVTREVVIAVLFGWSLIVVNYAFFPLYIIFYDWHGRFNLIPFASIAQLVRETSVTTAFYNIAGNLFLLAPLGILLPLLFKELRRPWPLIWRVAVISASIEIVQMLTNARAVDVDDVILNTTGAALAFGLFWVLARILRRSGKAYGLLQRLGASANREPLLLPAVPILGTAVIAVPVMVSMIFAATLGDGPSGILGHATADWPGSTIVARADVAQHAFLVIRDESDGSERLGIAGYKKVTLGRFTWVFGGEPQPGDGSRYGSSITAFNTAIDETPTFYVWGYNQAGATTLIVRGRNQTEELPLQEGPYFVVGFPHSPDLDSPFLETFEYQFLDESRNDVTNEFALSNG